MGGGAAGACCGAAFDGLGTLHRQGTRRAQLGGKACIHLENPAPRLLLPQEVAAQVLQHFAQLMRGIEGFAHGA